MTTEDLNFADLGELSAGGADLDFADLDTTLEGQDTIERPAVLKRKAKLATLNMMKRQKLQEVLEGIPEPGWTYHVISNGSFDFWTWIPVLVDLLEAEDHQVDDLWGSTWTANRTNIQELYQLGKSGRIKRGHLMTGIYFKRRETAAYATIVEAVRRLGWRYKAHQNHAKINMLAAGPHRIVIEGSANWTSNPRVEQYVISNSPQVFDFHAAWMEEVFQTAKGLKDGQEAQS